jgi:hypothetical protein
MAFGNHESNVSLTDQLKRLHSLYVSGAMTAKEYHKAKAELLEGGCSPERANNLDGERDMLWMSCPGCEEDIEVLGEGRTSTPLFVATCPRCGLVFDWRLPDNDYLRGATLRWAEYVAPSEVWDHDHCAMCWQKFMEEKLPGVEQAGYVTDTPNEVQWVCQRCLDDLGEEMGWQVEPPEERLR